MRPDRRAANGLQQPVVIDRTGQLIDGRNRLAACDMVQVEPEWRVIQDADAEAFIWGANVKRRQMNKGQIAMVAAMGVSIIIIETPRNGKGGRPDEGKTKAAKAAADEQGPDRDDRGDGSYFTE